MKATRILPSFVWQWKARRETSIRSCGTKSTGSRSEALRNAFRHAQAHRVEVEIRYDERQLRLRVRDDGKGIDRSCLVEDGRAGHYGLHGMRERAKVVGGKLAVWSELDSGTEVELSIPASHASETSAARRRSWLTEKLSGKLAGKDTELKS